jgi:hypothetical protein
MQIFSGRFSFLIPRGIFLLSLLLLLLLLCANNLVLPILVALAEEVDEARGRNAVGSILVVGGVKMKNAEEQRDASINRWKCSLSLNNNINQQRVAENETRRATLLLLCAVSP